MKRPVCLVAILLMLTGPHAVRAGQGRYTRSMFALGVRGDWTSPRYVLIGMRNPRTNSVSSVCVPGSSLVSAIQLEKNWSYAIGGRTKARGYAMRHWKKPFDFENSNALARVQAGYTEKQLSDVRERLSRFSNSDLKKQLRAVRKRDVIHETELQRLSAARNTPVGYVSRAAVAHVLLERGILVANDQRTSHLRLP
jgi:hypothetical protein